MRLIQLIAVTGFCLLSGCLECSNHHMIELRKAAERELHVGSDETEVKSFCMKNGLYYTRNTQKYGEAYKRAPCDDWAKPILMMELSFDESNRVASFEVSEFTDLP